MCNYYYHQLCRVQHQAQRGKAAHLLSPLTFCVKHGLTLSTNEWHNQRTAVMARTSEELEIGTLQFTNGETEAGNEENDVTACEF